MSEQKTITYEDGIVITGAITADFAAILTPEAMSFVARLARAMEGKRQALLHARQRRQKEIDSGILPDFLVETANIRQSDWLIAPLPVDLLDRRVEITGPVERKMVINALNSGAKVFMADFEDSHSPTWEGTIQGQINLYDSVRRTIQYRSPEGKEYRLHEQTAVLMVRPRGWHLSEKHILIDGQLISASLVDFGLYFFHNVNQLLANKTGPYFYLPKIESHLEARLWNDIFVLAQDLCAIPQGTIKATILIETILASFEMDEILYELREHSAGLNCGRWDYIFSAIKKFRNLPAYIFPDRAQVTMLTPFMRSYALLTIKTCHRRNAPAIGGMAAQIPIKNNPLANTEALERVRTDKQREAGDGHDGTWVAHPGLVSLALTAFDDILTGPNQIEKKCEDVQVAAADLLQVPEGSITEEGIRNNINVSLYYLEAWLRGNGCVPINHLMEDAATVEISRAQLWQWLHHPRGTMIDGRRVTEPLFLALLADELAKIEQSIGDERLVGRQFNQAAEILDHLVVNEEFVEFLTLLAYRYLN